MRVVRGVWTGLTGMLRLGAPLVASAALVPGGGEVLIRALWLIGGFGLIAATASASMAVWRPASLAVRQRKGLPGATTKQPLIDLLGLAFYVFYLVAWIAFIPWDVGYLHLLPTPAPWAMGAGLAFALAGCSVSYLAVWQNAFAAPAIEEQDGQHVVDTGLYGVIRHPLYAGNLLFFAGSALWLGSLAALVGVSVMVVATLARVVIEERFLRDHLPGYGPYAERVRARLIPFVI